MRPDEDWGVDLDNLHYVGSSSCTYKPDSLSVVLLYCIVRLVVVLLYYCVVVLLCCCIVVLIGCWIVGLPSCQIVEL